ncbi:MAG TPA: ABC transporter substrate-binding protein, partial [Bacillales bacterium]|nr:ABC transporter substrate-binding protein [Bacillales bacterium]
TMLLASAFLANQPGGTEVLNSTDFVYDYTDPMWVKTFAEIQKWFQNYTTDNAIGAAYADAANNFLNKRTAIIANGPWMTAAFSDTSKAPEGFEKKVGASIYPGGVALGSATGYYYWIPKKLSDEKTEAALAFLEFINSPEELEAYMVAEGGYAPNIKTSDDFLSKFGPILGDLKKDVKENMNEFTQSLGKIWPPQIVNSEFGRNLPLLANGSMTPEEFAKQLTEKAQKFK